MLSAPLAIAAATAAILHEVLGVSAMIAWFGAALALASGLFGVHLLPVRSNVRFGIAFAYAPLATWWLVLYGFLIAICSMYGDCL